MLTPQEIQNTGFRQAVFGGYVAEDVDEFLEIVVEDYEELFAENTVLKRKIKMLVDKLEEHRASEDAVRTVIASAQKKSEEMYKETREKCRKFTRETEENAKKIIAEAQAKVVDEERRLAKICTNVEQYVATVQKIIDKQSENLKELTKVTAENKESLPKNPVEQKPNNTVPVIEVQPKIETNSIDSVDTMTAEEINQVVDKILNEDKPKSKK